MTPEGEEQAKSSRDSIVAASLRAQFETARALAEGADLYGVLPIVLESFCGNLHWDTGAFWIIDNEHLQCAAFHGSPKMDRFREITFRKQLRRGEGLPGQVWASSGLVTLDLTGLVSNFPRKDAAVRCGLRFGMALPLKVQGQIYGALEFFRKTAAAETDLHFASAESIANQIGQFLAARAQRMALEFSESFHKSICDVAPDGIVTMDEKSTILSVNNAMCRIFGYSTEELIGSQLTKLMSPEIAEQHRRGMQRYLASGQKKTPWRGLELPGLHKNGSVIPLEIAFDALPMKGRRYFTGFIKDVSERYEARKKLEELNRTLEAKVRERTAELVELNQEMETFMFAAAHDLRAPLRAISSFSALLRESAPGSTPPAQEYLTRIERAAVRMDTLLLDLLQFSRVSKASLQLRPVPARAVVDSALQQLPDIANAVTVAGEFPWVWAEPALLEQIFANLLTNAFKFVRAGVRPQIRLSAEVDGEQVRLLVRDNGIGIDPHHQKKIFDLFTKLHSPDDFPGTGVGLAIAKRAAERMGGNLSVESVPGKGSTFSVTLKRAAKGAV